MQGVLEYLRANGYKTRIATGGGRTDSSLSVIH
jgi:hypothetical protein